MYTGLTQFQDMSSQFCGRSTTIFNCSIDTSGLDNRCYGRKGFGTRPMAYARRNVETNLAMLRLTDTIEL